MRDYFLRFAVNSAVMIFGGLVPCLLFACIMQALSAFLRKLLPRAAGKFLFLYLTAPGVVLHEFSHLFFCIVFRHKVFSVKFFSPNPANGTLGSVQHGYNPGSIYQRIGNFFIGTGPVWFGSAASMIFWILLTESDGPTSPGFWAWLWLLLSVLSHVSLSRKDLEGAADGLLFLLPAILLLNVILAFFWGFSFE